MCYDLLDKFERFKGEVDFVVTRGDTESHRPHSDEVIVVDGDYYRWASVAHAFIQIAETKTTTEKQFKKRKKDASNI